jgi:transcriptional regulator with AAA-type ATPase domain
MAVLCFLDSDRPGLRFPLSPGRTLIGRSDHNDLALPDPDISRVHAVLEVRDNRWWLLHRGRHPTLVNGAPVDACPLNPGDRIQIGRFTAVLEDTPRTKPAAWDHTTARYPREILHEEVLGTGEFGVAVETAVIRFVAGPLSDAVIDLDRVRVTLGGPGSDVRLVDLPPRAVTLRVNRGRVIVDPDLEVAVHVAGARINGAIPVYRGEPISVGPHTFVVEPAVHERSETRDRFGEMVGQTPVMRQLYGTLARMARHTHPVLLLGESGTGKELAARGLHAEGPRAQGPFFAVNCAALPEALVESELFGHVKGAFTGALRDQEGAFHKAQGGTLFLDEIGELKPDAQAKLLRTLESGEVRRVGAEKPEFPVVRVVAATHRDLGLMVERGQFRADLLFRLSVLTARLPPLRERQADIPLLFHNLVERGVLPGATLAEDALHRLQTYDWPGNVRELRNVLVRAYVMAGTYLTAPDLQFNPGSFEEVPARDPSQDGEERRLVFDVLGRTGGNRTRAAQILGIPRSSLLYRLRKWGYT